MRLPFTAIVWVLAGLVAGPSPALVRGGDGPLKVVVHLNTPDSETQGAGMKNVTNILKEDPQAQVEVVCHSGGISLLVKDQTKHKQAVEILAQQGVKFVACENTMRQKSIRKEDLLPTAKTVPSGAVEVVRKQQAGFAYFKP